MSKKSTLDRASLCTFTFADGRQCRMPWTNKRSKLCYFHQQQADQVDIAIQAGEKITACLSNDFVTRTSLNAALSRLFISVALGDYDLKTAHTLGYLAQIISKSIPGAKQELASSIGYDGVEWVLDYCLDRVNKRFCRPPRQPARGAVTPVCPELGRKDCALRVSPNSSLPNPQCRRWLSSQPAPAPAASCASPPPGSIGGVQKRTAPPTLKAYCEFGELQDGTLDTGTQRVFRCSLADRTPDLRGHGRGSIVDILRGHSPTINKDRFLTDLLCRQTAHSTTGHLV